MTLPYLEYWGYVGKSSLITLVESDLLKINLSSGAVALWVPSVLSHLVLVLCVGSRFVGSF